MKFTESMNKNLETLMVKYNISKEDLPTLAEVMTEAYELGYKEGLEGGK